MLGALLFVRQHFAFESRVFRLVFSAPPRSRDRPVRNIAALHLHQHFRRTADHRDIVQLQKEKIRRRIQRAKFPINLKRFGFGFCRKSLADYHLKNVARANIFFCFSYGCKICRLFEVGGHARRRCFLRGRLSSALFGSDGLFQQFSGSLNFLQRRIVFLLQGLLPFSENIADDPQPVLHVVERDQPVIKHQHRVKQANLVAQLFRQPLNQANHVVTEISDRSSDQRRQSRKTHGPESLDARAPKRNRIALFPNHAVMAFQNACAIRIAKNFFRMRTGKCVARNFFSALNGLQ